MKALMSDLVIKTEDNRKSIETLRSLNNSHPPGSAGTVLTLEDNESFRK